MKAILICPGARPAMEHLTAFAPLAALPLLGQSLIEYWLAQLALDGAGEVGLLANDRPDQIAALVADGARWGLKTRLLEETRELTPAQAQIKHARQMDSAAPHEIHTLDHFPGLSRPLFANYPDLFAGLIEWMPRARTADRVGVRELRPGVWTGLHARISADARLHPPCWIGSNVYVGARAVVGPMAVLEDRAFIESEAEISSSVIGPDTFVGQFAVIPDSFAWGNHLINWKTGWHTQVEDALVLSSLRRAPPNGLPETVFGRIAGIYSRNKDDLQMLWKHFLMNKEG